jgi:hypothetical protein
MRPQISKKHSLELLAYFFENFTIVNKYTCSFTKTGEHHGMHTVYHMFLKYKEEQTNKTRKLIVKPL